MTDFECGRYNEEVGPDSPFTFGKPYLRPDGTCSYCGSITEEAFFAAVEAGYAITPTDKNYKAYVEIPDPDVGKKRVVSSSNGERKAPWIKLTGDNIDTLGLSDADVAYYRNRLDKDWILLGEHEPTKRAKFYFQHLSSEGKDKFLALLNAGKFNLEAPGRFYVLPYFIQRVTAS